MPESPARPPQRAGESRKHKRFSVDVEASVRTSTGKLVQARTRDVSQTGICLVSQEEVGARELLRVDLVLAFGNNAYSEPLTLASRVVWCTRIGPAFQIGALFEDVTEEQDNFLEMFLQFLDGTLAPKGVDGDGDDDRSDGGSTSDDVDPIDRDDPFRP